MLRKKLQNQVKNEQPKGSEPKSPESLRKLGLMNNKDVQAMLKGSKIIKVRSSSWQKPRSFTLMEDCVTVSCESFKTLGKAKRDQAFCVTEVECVREGCQSECLRRVSDSVPEAQCFTLVFRGGRKSLDLCCSSREEAQNWVRGIRALKDRISNMSQKEKLDHWIRSYLKQADVNGDGKMSYEEVKHLLKMINIDLNEQYARTLFKELKGRILVKGKKLRNHLEKTNSTTSFSSTSDEETKSPNKKDSGKPASSSKISPELSDLVVYCNSMPFPGFDAARDRPPSEMSSFSENEALKHIKDSGKLFVRHNSRQLSRIYPSGQRLQSSNYDPQDMWNGGCQMVALNFQTPGEQMDLNRGRFLPNGRCGYVLKPDFLCVPNSNFNPENTGGGPGHVPTQLTIRVISAQQLPKLNSHKTNSIVDPQVWVEIHGVSIDKARLKTPRIDNNGFNPRWDCTLSFQLQIPELALVRFVVEDHDHKSKNDFVGQFTIPFLSLRTGYRHVHLLKADGSSLSPATLFIHVKVSRRGSAIKNVTERMGKV